MILGENLSAWRKFAGLERVQLAAAMCHKGRKTSEHDLWRWETGRNSPDVKTLNAIAEVLDEVIDSSKVSLDTLVNDLPPAKIPTAATAPEA